MSHTAILLTEGCWRKARSNNLWKKYISAFIHQTAQQTGDKGKSPIKFPEQHQAFSAQQMFRISGALLEGWTAYFQKVFKLGFTHNSDISYWCSASLVMSYWFWVSLEFVMYVIWPVSECIYLLKSNAVEVFTRKISWAVELVYFQATKATTKHRFKKI